MVADSAAPYISTEQGQAFIDGLITPKFVEIVHTFDAEVGKLRTSLEQVLASEFDSVRSEIKSEVSQIRETMRSHIAALRSELMTRTDDKLLTFHKSSPSLPAFAEPPILAEVSFSGDSSHLTAFLYAIYDALLIHEARFANNDRRVKWVARHLRPATSPAANWWSSLVAQNASLFDR